MSAREPVILVGASASIFGLVGASLSWLACDRHARAAPGARADLAALAVVIVAQVLIDAASPTPSGAAHVGGALAGVILGLAFRFDDAPITRAARR